jgi:hypothetical protein
MNSYLIKGVIIMEAINKIYEGGVVINDNFSCRTARPLDDREVV